jgi:predicted transcriptional regulator
MIAVSTSSTPAAFCRAGSDEHRLVQFRSATFAAQIVSAHVSHNAVSPAALPGGIQAVYAALSGLGVEKAAPSNGRRPAPAVPPKKSVFPDYIVCLEDGKKLKMLKRHLKTAYGMTPEQYRERWGLPPTYPMTAPNYTAQRSALAKSFGLGRIKADEDEAPPALPVQKMPAGVRGKRKKKAAE